MVLGILDYVSERVECFILREKSGKKINREIFRLKSLGKRVDNSFHLLKGSSLSTEPLSFWDIFVAEISFHPL